MGLHTQKDTHHNLLGTAPSSSIEKYSCETQVRPNTPPTLILVSDDDTIVSPINSIHYYEALKKQHIPATLYIFPQGDHAWGIKGLNMFGKKFEYAKQVKELILKWISNYCLSDGMLSPHCSVWSWTAHWGLYFKSFRLPSRPGFHLHNENAEWQQKKVHFRYST